MRAVVEFGFAGYGLGIHLPVLVEFELGINAAYAIEANFAAHVSAERIWKSVQLAVRIDKPNAVVLAQLAIHAHHAKVGALAGKRVSIDDATARRAIIGHHDPNGPRAFLAGQAQAIKWIDNAPREHQIQRCLKEVGVFLEERAFFGKENFKALVHRDLRIV